MAGKVGGELGLMGERAAGKLKGMKSRRRAVRVG